MNKRKEIHMATRGLLALIMLILLSDNGYAREEQQAASKVGPANSRLAIEANTAQAIKFDKGVSEVFIANPDIADIQMNSPHTAYIFAKKPGLTTFIATDASGRVVKNLTIEVSINSSAIKELIKKLNPDENIEVHATPRGVILKGKVSSSKIAKNMTDVARRFLASDTDEVVNELSVTQPTQVMIKVKIAEVNRSVLNQLDINWTASGPLHANNPILFGLLQGQSAPFTAPKVFARPDGLARLGASYSGNKTSLTALIDMIDNEGLGTVLAEPNLVAISGETASFLAGGEFPIPVPQEQNVTIEFKQFGISLAFTPTVLGENQINLRVRPEVSQLDQVNRLTYQVAGGATVDVPAISTRRVDTTIELASGQSFAIAGLYNSTLNSNMSEIPGLADIPVLGALFRSSKFERKESELVVVVTPYIVEPRSNNDFKTPTEDVRFASHIETILNGEMSKPSPSTAVNQDPLTQQENGQLRLVGTSGFYHE